ncbi:MAG: dockerin type I repeat-containing protein [Ruminococcus sp.]|nr:dockerin type I repeat-containing protein [Ruminococcus sp.]
MKKTIHTLLTAAAFAASLNMSAAGNVSAGTLSDVNAAPDRMGYDPSTEEVQDVYGPAPSYDDENLVYDPIVTSTVLDVQNIQTTYVWLTSTSTTTTVPVTLYGPPPAYYYETTNTTAVSDVEDIINVTNTTMPAPVYGPPQIFYQPGDINGDQIIDVFDMILFRKHLLNEDTPEWMKHVLDVNRDGEFAVSDLVALQNFILGRDKDLNYGYPQPTYGPEPDYNDSQETEELSNRTETTSPEDEDKNQTTTTTVIPDIEEPITTLDPSKMPVQVMYGPPEYFGLDPETLQPKE